MARICEPFDAPLALGVHPVYESSWTPQASKEGEIRSAFALRSIGPYMRRLVASTLCTRPTLSQPLQHTIACPLSFQAGLPHAKLGACVPSPLGRLDQRRRR